ACITPVAVTSHSRRALAGALSISGASMSPNPAPLVGALLALASAAFSQDRPLVMENGQAKQLPAATTLRTSASTAAAASLNIPCASSAAPGAPNDGDVWCTASGLYMRVGAGTVGPLGAGSGTVTTSGAPAAGALAKFSGASAITSGDL